MQYWLVKTEPEEYSFFNLVKDKKAIWDGIRNYQARNNLKKMKEGDIVFIYHTGKNKEIVGLGKVEKEFYSDPKDKTNTWVVVELIPYKEIKKAVSLNEMKKEKSLSSLPLFKQNRLSVMPISENEYKTIIRIGGNNI